MFWSTVHYATADRLTPMTADKSHEGRCGTVVKMGNRTNRELLNIAKAIKILDLQSMSS